MQVQISWLLKKPTDLGLHFKDRVYLGSAGQGLSSAQRLSFVLDLLESYCCVTFGIQKKLYYFVSLNHLFKTEMLKYVLIFSIKYSVNVI